MDALGTPSLEPVKVRRRVHAFELRARRGTWLQRDDVGAQTGCTQTRGDGFQARGSFRVTGTGVMADEARIRRKEEHLRTVVLVIRRTTSDE